MTIDLYLLLFLEKLPDNAANLPDFTAAQLIVKWQSDKAIRIIIAPGQNTTVVFLFIVFRIVK